MTNRITVFTGQAGTGKTTSLISHLKELIESVEFKNHQSVLAITFMHGSRRRLNSKIKILGNKYGLNIKCTTIDSFVVSIINRFRSYLNTDKIISTNVENDEIIEISLFEILMPLELIQKKVINLLDLKIVQDYIGNSYPVVVIDEFQDCEGNILKIIKKLSLSTNLIIATDPFQQLNDQEKSVTQEWLEVRGAKINNLDGKIWRTNNNRILNTATSLRKGEKIEGKKIEVKLCPSYYIASALININVYYSFLNRNNIAIISPVNSSRSSFVQNSLKQLSKGHTFKSGKNIGKKIGPYHHLISSIEKSDINEICENILHRDLTYDELISLNGNEHYIIKQAIEIALKRLRLRGNSKISAIEFKSILDQTAHTYDNFIIKDLDEKLTFTTIHGAKNREFDNVIILWPYEVTGNLIYRRKLLYNAVTRAKKKVIILVQHKNSKQEELTSDDLFSLILD